MQVSESFLQTKLMRHRVTEYVEAQLKGGFLVHKSLLSYVNDSEIKKDLTFYEKYDIIYILMKSKLSKKELLLIEEF